ncbi:MAG: class I SAM-dependent methyltransferase [Gammaproteobacteria bacterium]|nr:class I SAM-dependent methyltransferase [Gammaproteobacteria bacterium]
MDQVDFGYERVTPEEKSARVQGVFASVAPRYDLMNDLMSFGIHRLWKRFAVGISGVRAGAQVLDVAGGTGDCTTLYRRAVGESGSVTLCDVNDVMLRIGRDRLLDAGLASGVHYARCDAECLPFASGRFDCVNIAFGLRNVTRKERALESMHRVLKFGGVAIVLEFSRVVLPMLRELYDAWSTRVIPYLGGRVAGDEASYRYLVESIRVHPDQESLQRLMEQAGFSKVRYFNLSGGIVAVHRGYKL